MSRELDVFLHFDLLVGAVCCWFFSPQQKGSKPVCYVGLFLCATLLFDGAAATIMLNHYLAKKVVSNLFLYHILTPIQYLLIAAMYGAIIKHPLIRKAAIWSIPPFVIISLLFSFTIQPISEYNSYSILIKHFLVIMFALIYFFEIISTTPYTKVYLQPVFWISVGYLFHSTLNISLEGVSNYLRTYGQPSDNIIYFLYSISNYCLFLLIGVGLLVSNVKPESNESESFAK
jgi:hypothetical protein